ncbi:MAG: AMP-binding protein [Methylotenera sp.]|nr:AMP-binding protein [Methylotenera sp.]
MLIRSQISGLTWPSIPLPADAMLLALQFQLEQSQWWTLEQIQHHQLLQAKSLLVHAVATVPYYKQTIPQSMMESVDDLDWALWQSIPILERKDVQEHSQNLISKAIPQSHQPVGIGMTSGSTGRPISLMRTKITSIMWDAFTLRTHLWYDRNLSKKRAAIKYFESGVAIAPLGAQQLGWGSASDMFLPQGEVVALNVSTPIQEQVQWLLKEQPDYLVSYPSNLTAIAEHCIRGGIALPNLRELATIGELLCDEQRNVCREAFGLEIIDTYSAEEVGYIAMQCPLNQHLHMQSENVLVEVIDDDGNPCKSGEIGRVIITTLHNFAKPLIRYAIGDYAKVGEPCECGRGLPVLKKVMGRARNMFVKPDGSYFWPSFPKVAPEFYAQLPKVRQYQYVQKAIDWIEIRIAVNARYSESIEQVFAEATRKEFGYPYRVTFLYLNEIAHSKYQKYEEFLSEI